MWRHVFGGINQNQNKQVSLNELDSLKLYHHHHIMGMPAKAGIP